MPASRPLTLTGFFLALASAASFGLSGIFAASLITGGWSAGAAAFARIGFAALILLPPTLIALRGQWDLVRRAWKQVLLFGVLAVAGCQLAYFLAVQFIPPSLALVIEFMGPVLLMLWSWSRTRLAPSWITLLGAGVAVLGLIAISGVAIGGALHPLGVLFALVAAIGNAAYYAAGAVTDHRIPPLPFVGLGLMVATVVLALAGAAQLLPFRATKVPVQLAAAELSPIAVVAGMVLISTVLSYVLGVAASRRLGATVASFTGYAEPLFGILWTILLLTIMPTPAQWLGAALIIAGVITIKLGELRRTHLHRLH